jgi:hypothetical protein
MTDFGKTCFITISRGGTDGIACRNGTTGTSLDIPLPAHADARARPRVR